MEQVITGSKKKKKTAEVQGNEVMVRFVGVDIMLEVQPKYCVFDILASTVEGRYARYSLTCKLASRIIVRPKKHDLAYMLTENMYN